MSHYLVTEDACKDIRAQMKNIFAYFDHACKFMKCDSKDDFVHTFDYADEKISPHLYNRVQLTNKVCYISRISSFSESRRMEYEKKGRFAAVYTIVCENFIPSCVLPITALDASLLRRTSVGTDLVVNCFGRFTDYGDVKNAFADVVVELFQVNCRSLF